MLEATLQYVAFVERGDLLGGQSAVALDRGENLFRMGSPVWQKARQS